MPRFTVNSMLRRATGRFAAILLAALAFQAQADTVTLRNGKTVTDVTVTGMDAKKVALTDGKGLDRGSVATIVRDAYTIPHMPGEVVLRDGSRVAGAVRNFKSGVLQVRTLSFGQLGVPLAQIAALRYGGASPHSLPDAPADGEAATAVRRDGTQVSGKVMWADSASVGLLAKSGLMRIPSEELLGVVMAPAKPRVVLVLRNGDRFTVVRKVEGDVFTVDLAGSSQTVSLSAVKEIYLNPMNKE